MRFCGAIERSGDAPAYRLQTKRPKVWVPPEFQNLQGLSVLAVVLKAGDRWTMVCDVKFGIATSLADCDLHIELANLGGRGGVLADCELPGPGYRPQRMRIDVNEQWGSFDHAGSGATDLCRVVCHEIGHFLGFDHFDANPPPELMEPTYSPTVISPQSTEARVARNWFGPPKSAPTTQPAPAGVVLKVSGGPIPPGEYRLG